jgi:hypothetical protein
MAFKLYNFGLAKDLPKIIQVEQSGMTISGLFDYLETELGSNVKTLALENGMLSERSGVAINGQPQHDMDAIIPDGSQVLMLYLMPGG